MDQYKTMKNNRPRNNFLFLGISLLVIGLICYFFTGIVLYLVIAFVLSTMGQPIMRFLLYRLNLNKFKFGQPLAAILTLVLYLSILGLIIAFFVPVITSQASYLTQLDLDQIAKSLQTPLESLAPYAQKFGMNIDPSAANDLIHSFFTSFLDASQLKNIFAGVVNFASGLVIGIFSVLFISFYFLQSRGMFQNFIYAIVPKQYEERVRKTIEATVNLLSRYFAGIFLQLMINTTYVSILLTILGVKNALLIGFLAALTNIIPYIGPLIGAGLGVLITITSQSGSDFYTEVYPMCIRVVISMGVMQLVDNFILQPYIFSNSVKAHPLEIFLVILAAGQIMGVWGMVLAVPVYTMLRVVAKNFLSEFRIVQRLTKSIDAPAEQ